MDNYPSVYRDREEAGRYLADALKIENLVDPVILALPRGGVPVGYEIARRLRVPLDIVVVRKIGAPGNPEYGIGAVAEDGTTYVDWDAAAAAGADEEFVRATAELERKEIARRIAHYRRGKPEVEVRGRTVVVVDDGLATGVSARVACRFLSKKGAGRVVLAVPVCSPRTSAHFESEVSSVVCLNQPESFFSVSQFYEDFAQVSDEEVIELLEQIADAGGEKASVGFSEEVNVSGSGVKLPGDLTVPRGSKGIVIFAHGSGSSRLSPRNREIAASLNRVGLGTLLFDLLTPTEALNRFKVFDIPFLASRLVTATRWLQSQPTTGGLPIGYFGASTGAGAALWAAAEMGHEIRAVVSRGGRPDLAIPRLRQVETPTLLIVGGDDEPVIEMNREAQHHLKDSRLIIVAGATHLFEEPGALEAVATHAADWFLNHLPLPQTRRKAA